MMGAQRLSRPARLLLGGYLASAVGTGAVYPYLAIYIQQVRGLGGSTAAAALAIVAIGTIGGSAAAGASVDRRGPRLVGSAGLVLQAVGYGVTGVSSGPVAVFAACAVIGLGNGIFYAALSPAITATCPPHQHRRVFALRYLYNNLGLGAGMLLSSIVLSGADPARFTALYEVNAASFLVFLVVFGSALSGGAAPERSGPTRTPDEVLRWRTVLANRPFRWLLLVQILLVAGGFSQLQAAIPLLVQVQSGTSTLPVVLLLTVNCFGIVLVQPLVTRLSARVPEWRLLAVMGAVWAVAFAVGLLASVLGFLDLTGLLLFGVIYTLGECCYGPSFHPLVVKVAGTGLGRYSSLVWSAWGTTTFVAPPLAVLLVNSPWPNLLWLLCGLCCAGAAGCAHRVRSCTVTAEQATASRE